VLPAGPAAEVGAGRQGQLLDHQPRVPHACRPRLLPQTAGPRHDDDDDRGRRRRTADEEGLSTVSQLVDHPPRPGGLRTAQFREIRGNGDRSCRNIAGMEMGAAEIPRGWNLFLREARGTDASAILPTIKIMAQALEYWGNCRVNCLMWLLNMPDSHRPSDTTRQDSPVCVVSGVAV